MYISEQLIEFSKFIMIGIILSVIFDFFRAYRRIKKVSFATVALQDILYFLIVTIILIFSIIFLLNTSIRVYIFLAIFVGIIIYITFLSKFFINMYIFIFKTIKNFLLFLILPCKLFAQIIIKIYNFFEKYTKKCCKMFSNMVLNIYSKLSNLFAKLFKKGNVNKRGLKIWERAHQKMYKHLIIKRKKV